MKAVGYFRVSTTKQAIEGVSLEAQHRKWDAWCELEEVHVLGAFEDAGRSGKRIDNRPRLQAALDLACSEKAILVVYSLSRLARNTRETLEIFERLRKAGAHLVSLTEKIDTTTACGTMIFRLLAVMAEFERDQTSERTQAIADYLKANGRRAGTVPYGYVVSVEGKIKTLSPIPEQQGWIAKMQRWYASKRSYGWIAFELNRLGIPTKHGKHWHSKTIAAILKRHERDHANTECARAADQ